ncbi:MAG: extracellular solute-binding protein [Bacteroidota bacterium]
MRESRRKTSVIAALLVLIVSSLSIGLAAERLTLPIVKTPLTLTWFKDMGSKGFAAVNDFNQMACFKEMQRLTGIQFEFRISAVGQANQQINLIVASRNLPDLMDYTWTKFPGGAAKLAADGLIIELNDLIDKYAPNFQKLMRQHPEWRKMVADDAGKIYFFPFVRSSELNKLMNGFMIRKDWLDKLKLKVPTNMKEWYTVLKAFKERDPNGNGKADEIPFLSEQTNKGFGGFTRFMYAFGIAPNNRGFIPVNGRVKYSYMEPAYLDYLKTMNKWYKEGLIDPEFALCERALFNAKVATNTVGAMQGGCGMGFMGLFIKTMRDKGYTDFSLVGTPFPKATDGKVYGFKTNAVTGDGTVITTANKHVKETVKWLDYCYSKEGSMLMSYGPKGQAYTVSGGKSQFKESILKSSLGLDSAIMAYGLAPSTGPFVVDDLYWRTSTAVFPEQGQALEIWAKASDALILPPVTPTPQESERFAAIMNAIITYQEEMHDKFVMGQEPLENFPRYIENLKKMGIEEAIKIQQAALDRYLKR